MRNNLLEFLFGNAVIRESSEQLGEQVVKLFEEAADEETEQMIANKTPLATVLKGMGISSAVEAESQCCYIRCRDREEYREHVRMLSDPDNMHKLAEKGWVMTKCGDEAMTFEPADFKIGFIELDNMELGNSDKAPDLEKIRKDAQKFASTPIDRDDDLNSVENDDKTSSDRDKGVGKPSDGKDPEGTPKGSKKTSESKRGKNAKQVTESLLEMTSTGAIPTMDPPMKATGMDWKRRMAALRKRRGEKPDGTLNEPSR